MDKLKTGSSGEKLAVNFLKKQGYKIIETNFKSKAGEVDIIAQEIDTLVFIEVKTRHSREFGLPEEAVGYRKLGHIRSVINYYRALRQNLPEGDRIDVVAIEVGQNETVERLELIKNVTG